MKRTPQRVLALAAAGALTLALMPLGVAAQAAPSVDGLVADYAFTQLTGSAVQNLVPGGAPATVERAADSQWTGSSLTFTGGAKNGSGNWVRLPSDLLAGDTSASITTEVRFPSAMKRDYNFLWNIGNDASTQYFFATVKDAARTAITKSSNGGEKNARASFNLDPDRWYSLTSVLDGAAGTLSFYVDGALAGSTATSLTPASIADQSLNAIGRSPWPDPLFAGEVSAFRVYDRALTPAEVEQASIEDAGFNSAAIEAEANKLLASVTLPKGDVARDRIALPTLDGAVSWASSAPEVVALDGTVTQPEAGEAPVSVTLTAAVTLRGITVSRDTTVRVLPSQLAAAERLALDAERYALPQTMASGDELTAAPDGLVVTVTDVAGATLEGNALVADAKAADVKNADAKAAAPARVTVNVARASDPSVTVAKTFEVQLLTDAAQLLAYHRTPTSEQTANNADVALSMHLALAGESGWQPLNENYGVFFAQVASPVPATGPDSSLIRSLQNPSVFELADGSYGVIATRVARGGGADGTQANKALIATTSDLRSYDEIGMLQLDEADGVLRPSVIFDTDADTYRVSWVTASGAERHQSFDDLLAAAATPEAGESVAGRVSGPQLWSAAEVTGIDEAAAGGSQLTVPQSIAADLTQRYGRTTNTGYTAYDDVTVDPGATDLAAALPATTELTYSDGSTRALPVVGWDVTGVDTATPGSYKATATVKQTEYPKPFADERADPSVYSFDYNGEDRYLMIATNDIYGDNIHQQGRAFMPIRIADTISGLADDAGGDEIHLLDRGDLDAYGNAMTGCFWAPEFHEIDGKLSILFMPCYDSSPNMMTGRASIMQLGQDQAGNHLDPANPANWSKPQHVVRADGSALNDVSGISLDMTYFTDADGQAYYAWQQVCVTFIAKVDPANPTKLTSDPVRIITPEYAWDNVCAEGPNVHTRDGKLYMIYSGSSVGDTYTTGLALADASGSDLTDPASWQKLNAPLQKSGLFEGDWQLGTGHGMWSEDEDGNLIYVFHARTDHNGLSGRDMFVRRVHFDAEGIPVLDMEADEELAAPTVSLTVVVRDPNGGGTAGSDGSGAGGTADAAGGTAAAAGGTADAADGTVSGATASGGSDGSGAGSAGAGSASSESAGAGAATAAAANGTGSGSNAGTVENGAVDTGAADAGAVDAEGSLASTGAAGLQWGLASALVLTLAGAAALLRTRGRGRGAASRYDIV